MNLENKTNILVKANVLLHRTVGRWQSSLMTFGINKGYFVTIILTIMSLIKLYIDGGLESVEMTVTSLWPVAATFCAGSLTVVSNIGAYVNSSQRYQVINDKAYKDAIIQSIQISKIMVDNGYKMSIFNNSVSDEYYIMSSKVNKLLFDNQLEIEKLSSKFYVVDEIKAYIPTIMKRNFKSKKLIFNGKLLRMSSELLVDTQSVAVQYVRYFDYLCTNEIVYKKIKSTFSIDEVFLGERLLVNSENQLFDNELSSCANIIGASTLVLTKDNHMIIGKQGEFSKSNSGRYAPSGSGSVDYKDLKACKTFNEVIIKAMEREFCEECNYSLEKSLSTMNTVLVGYTKLVERGAKPDFFGISYINEYAANLENGVKKIEHGLSHKFITLPFGSFDQLSSTLSDFCTQHKYDKTLSIQVHLLNEIIKDLDVETLMTRLKA